MKLIVSLTIDENDRHDMRWNDASFFGIIASFLKNPHGYDEIEKIELIFDNQERKLKLTKNQEIIDVNLKVRKERYDDKSVLIAEIWPIRVAQPF
jgi:hypothetical protein